MNETPKVVDTPRRQPPRRYLFPGKPFSDSNFTDFSVFFIIAIRLDF